MTGDLVTWLCDQLDEDEQDARRRYFHTDGCGRFLDPGDTCSCELSDRVLAEVRAKRQILRDMAHVIDGESRLLVCDDRCECGDGPPVRICRTVRLLAEIYADQPGYWEVWRP